MKKLISAGLILALLLVLVPVSAKAEEPPMLEDVVILYTNDVHTYIDGNLSYDVIARVKQALSVTYKHVLLVDAGDHAQGTAYGSMDKGYSVISLMNAAGYDVATLGNHEFDYNMSGCENIVEWAEYPYISCNFYHEKLGVRGENVLDSYVLFPCGDEVVAFVGITTPETMSKSTPAYFQDGNGQFIYGISGGEDGEALYQDVQAAIDEARAAGATRVIALGHLGVDASSGPWTSEATIAAVTGLDAFIDGHSHTVMEGQAVADKSGKEVILTQTGEYFGQIGIMVIDAETGAITTEFITYNPETGKLTIPNYATTELIREESVQQMKELWLAEIDRQLGQSVGSFQVTFDNYDENGNRIVRGQETNSGDFSADALYYLFDSMDLDVDVAVMNGGGIRNQALTGQASYKTCKDIHPFGNVACLLRVTGQQLLDFLEWGARNAGVMEDGSFMQASGVTYKIDISVPNTTQANEQDVWISGPTQYRVYDVQVYSKASGAYEPLDLTAIYNLAGYNYTLRDMGGGFAMLSGAENVLDYVMEDYMVLAHYISGFENGVVGAKNSPLLAKYPGLRLDYGTVHGSGRIALTDGRVPEELPPTGDASLVWVMGILILCAGAIVLTGKKRSAQV